jgi:Methyltransferase domain
MMGRQVFLGDRSHCVTKSLIETAWPEPASRDPYERQSSLPYAFRRERFRHVAALIDQIIAEKGHCRILDVGGTEQYWKIAGDTLAARNIHIDLLNIEAPPVVSPLFTSLTGDASDLPDMADRTYDLVHSNSVIEHVGSWNRMVAMAANVRRLAPRYYLQTPNFWFPLEPHFRTPFFHWLPEQIRYRILLRTPLGFRGQAFTVDEAMRSIQGAYLLDRRQMAALFPDARLERERFFGLTKSHIVIRG